MDCSWPDLTVRVTRGELRGFGADDGTWDRAQPRTWDHVQQLAALGFFKERHVAHNSWAPFGPGLHFIFGLFLVDFDFFCWALFHKYHLSLLLQ